MSARQIVVIGASAGGIEALRELVAGLPADFPAPVCVVLHSSPQSPGVLHSILGRAGRLPAENGRDRQRVEPGRVYVAPPDCHLLIEPGRLRVTKGPKENRFRPAIDPLFRSAAQVYGPGAIGVILTGNLDDGTAGLWALKQLGGTTIVQDPSDAMFPSMPENALRHVRVDYSVPLAQIPGLLVGLTAEAPPEIPAVVEASSVQEAVRVEVKIAMEENALDAGIARVAEPSSFACPDCHGVLLRLKEAGPIRFRCHTGHAYSLDSLVAAISEGIEQAIWNAIRALEEGDMLMRAVGAHLTEHKHESAAPLLERAAEAKRQGDLLRKLIAEREPLVARP